MEGVIIHFIHFSLSSSKSADTHRYHLEEIDSAHAVVYLLRTIFLIVLFKVDINCKVYMLHFIYVSPLTVFLNSLTTDPV